MVVCGIKDGGLISSKAVRVYLCTNNQQERPMKELKQVGNCDAFAAH
jgi:hypothetical protein